MDWRCRDLIKVNNAALTLAKAAEHSTENQCVSNISGGRKEQILAADRSAYASHFDAPVLPRP
jgi:hypothetical protein